MPDCQANELFDSDEESVGNFANFGGGIFI